MNRPARIVARLVVVAVVSPFAVVAAELVCRALDGYQLFAFTLNLAGAPRGRLHEANPDRQYVDAIARTPSVRIDWYADRPQPARIPLSNQ